MAVSPDAVEYILDQLTKRQEDVASRFEIAMGRLDSTYVRKETFEQWTKTADEVHRNLIDARLAAIATHVATEEQLDKRIMAMEESRQWLFRLCAGSTVVAVISVLVTSFSVLGHH